MTESIYYASAAPFLDWVHWQPGSPPEALPPTHAQAVDLDSAAMIEQYQAGLARVVDACPGEVLQYSRRVCVVASRVAVLRGELAAAGLELSFGPPHAIIEGPGATTLRLGYIGLQGAPDYPPLSAMGRGLQEGHCLLVRTAAIVHAETEELPPDIRHKADLDVLHRHRPPKATHPIWTTASSKA